MRGLIRLAALALACVMLPTLAHAQASITGVVKDASGGLLPGVTVEASSPALIEKVRSVSTDGTGQYKIVDLRPGSYTVTFTLAGFSAVKREGIELTGSFAATVNADLNVGSVAETITVTGASPVVDVHSASQERVMSKEIVDAIPVGRAQTALAVLVPGMTAGAQDVGGTNTLGFSPVAIHGGRSNDQRLMIDGLLVRNVATQGWNSNTMPDMGASQEMTINYAGGNGEAITSGVIFNFIPREGGNRFQGSIFGTATSSGFQGTNYTQELQDLGLRAPNHLKNVFDFNPSAGGPISKDKLWFYSSVRAQGNRNYVAGLWNNLNAGNPNAWTYNPDLSQQAVFDLTSSSVNTRLTWQASPLNKFNIYYDNQWRDYGFTVANISPESRNHWSFPRLRTGTLTWSSPRTSRLLLEAKASVHAEDIRDFYPTDPADPFRTLIAVNEQGGTIPGLTYRGLGAAMPANAASIGSNTTNTYETTASLTYVTGSHAFKVGFNDFWGTQSYASYDVTSETTYRFNNTIPNQITERQTLYDGLFGGVRGELGFYAQDKWTLKRLTLSPALRFDYVSTGFDAVTLGPVPLVPNRNINFPETPWYRFKDLNPRIGASYDLFGNGKTALKGNVGRYNLAVDPSQGNPIGTQLVPRVTRTWTDANRDYIPDCDLVNPQQQDLRANGGDFCSTISDLRFGTAIPSTSFDPATKVGWGTRPYDWEFSTSVQHEVIARVGIDVGYFRRIYGNFIVTDNLLTAPSDFSPFSVTAPMDPRLPDGGGYVVSGLYNVNPNKVGQVSNFVTRADNFGTQIEHWNGVDFNVNARFPGGALLRGGLSTGRTTQNTCAIVTSNVDVVVATTIGAVQSTQMCDVVTPFLTQVKLLATYPIRKVGVDVAATFQSLPGPLIAANFVASNALVQPSLGRPLSGGAPNTTVNLVTPGTLYGERLNQLDLRFTKSLRLGPERLRVSLDVYNALNGNYIRTINANYASWLTPTAILDPRLFKISAQFDF
jgi:Carboxypeptidase regulatory-like domain